MVRFPGGSSYRPIALPGSPSSSRRAAGLHLYAGHGLTVENVGPIATIEGMEELNIGHALVSRAVLIGMGAAVAEMLGAMNLNSPGAV